MIQLPIINSHFDLDYAGLLLDRNNIEYELELRQQLKQQLTDAGVDLDRCYLSNFQPDDLQIGEPIGDINVHLK